MKLHHHLATGLIALACLPLAPNALAEDKKLSPWEQQQQAIKQWKLQKMLTQPQPQKHPAGHAPLVPWQANQGGRGALSFTGQPPDRLSGAVVNLSNFSDVNGNIRPSGAARLTLNGGGNYTLQGTWTVQGNFTVGLTLTPSNPVRGDRVTGNLTMSQPNGDTLASITLTGVMGGAPFTANFSAR